MIGGGGSRQLRGEKAVPSEKRSSKDPFEELQVDRGQRRTAVGMTNPSGGQSSDANGPEEQKHRWRSTAK